MSRPTDVDCPLCGWDCEDRNGLRVHLHGSHLKSEIIDVYLDIASAGRPGARGREPPRISE